MNTKRQTIWLVSMLSLMVVLSAYYLFTQEIGNKDQVSDVTQLQNVAEVANVDGSNATETSGGAEQEGDYTISEVDQEVLNQLQADNFFDNSTFSALELKREQLLENEQNRINATIADVNADAESSMAALAEMAELEESMDKITQLENKLMETYEIAVISPEVDDKYKVVVSSDTLEKKQAAQIIDEVITAMELRPEQVSVQFVSNP